MSNEDETFDIDLYGDDAPEEEQQQQDGDTSNARGYGYDGQHDDTQPSAQEQPTANAANGNSSTQPPTSHAEKVQQGTKRKAPDDESSSTAHHVSDSRPVDPGAQVSIKLTELQWWTTEEDIRGYCARAAAELELIEVAFGEHKINGKSRGEAYLEFTSPQAAGAVKREIEKTNVELEATGKSGGTAVGGKIKISVWYTAPGNPFRVREGQGKKDIGGGGSGGAGGGKYGGQQGAYNQYPNNNRGGFANRGNRGGNYGGGMARGGGGGGGGGQWNMQNQNTAGNFQNPMMSGYGNMAFGGMGNYSGMGLNQGGGMMGGMMGRGGFPMGGMGMGMPGMMSGRGGGNMMGRGTWGGSGGAGFQGMQQQGGYGMGGAQQGNKKPRTE